MVSKKKLTTLRRRKTKKHPHWKDLALLLSNKKQLNVVLRRDIIPPAVASTSESSVPESNNFELHHEILDKKENSTLDEEDFRMIRNKKEFIAPEPALNLPPESNDQGSTSSIRSRNHLPEFNFRVQGTPSNNTDETYNIDVLQPSQINRKIDQLIFQYANQSSKEPFKNAKQESNSPSKKILDSSTNVKTRKKEQYIPKIRMLRRRLLSKYKIQKNKSKQNREHFTYTVLQSKPSGRPVITKIDNSEEQNKDKEHGNQDQTEENNEDDSSISRCNLKKRLRKRPPKANAQDKKTIQNARDIENQLMEISTESNLNNTNLNVVVVNTTSTEEKTTNKTKELECHTIKKYVMDTEKNKITRKPKSIAHELQLLRKRVIGVSKSQKQIQDALLSTPNDRFELIGKTIAACLRELPRFESQSLEIKLMDVLLEEKRNIMTLATQSINSNGVSG